MNEKKMALAEPPSLSLADIVKCAQVDCADYFELGFEGEPEAAQLFQGFRMMLDSLAVAVKRDQVNGIIHGVVKDCIAYVHARSSAQTPRLRETVESELAALKGWLARLCALMAPLQEERIDMEDSGAAEANTERYQALQKSITELASIAQPVETRKAELEHYLSSLSVVERGVGEHSFKLPELPEMAGAVCASASPASLGEVFELSALVKQVGYHPAEVLAYSLFDLLGPKNQKIDGKNRGVMRIIQTAYDVGILERHGMESVSSAMRGSQWKDTRGFLEYRGSVGGSTTFVRSEKPLPWVARALLTEAEMRSFLEQIKGSPTPRA